MPRRIATADRVERDELLDQPRRHARVLREALNAFFTVLSRHTIEDLVKSRKNVRALLGIDEVYAVGGAQAIAMFAHGAGECRPVDLVTGPGNIYVVSAKRYLKGIVGIDSEAGPTEIAILADDTADAGFVAADLISQAEHDELAAAVLVTDSAELADAGREWVSTERTWAANGPRYAQVYEQVLGPRE